MRSFFVNEPELEFGSGRRHVDVRFGIMNHGPVDLGEPHSPRQVNLGLIGTTKTIQGVSEWFDRCREVVPAAGTKQPYLRPMFPGCAPDVGLRTTLVTSDSATRSIPVSSFSKLGRASSPVDRVEAVVDLLYQELESLVDSSPSVDVVVCAVPNELLDVIEAASDVVPNDEPEDDIAAESRTLKHDYHDLLKARAMDLRKPIQIIRPTTYDPSQRRKAKNTSRQQTQQDEATKAWNLHTALYYKAGGTPWRLVRESSALDTCYVGVSFYKSLDETTLKTSVAQVFNERGEGVIVKGGTAHVSREDRQPHLSVEDAESLLRAALKRYRGEHRNLPARVVMHKSSPFDHAELEGFSAALSAEGIFQSDLISIGRSHTRLSRTNVYPPLRGTVLCLSEAEHVVYTKGSVEFFQTWPGGHAPAPRLLRLAEVENSPRFLVREILALSKMNWNNTQFDGAEPITLRAARQVSRVLRYCDDSKGIESRYSFYM